MFERLSLCLHPQDWKTWLAWAVFERRAGRLGVAEYAFKQGTAVAPSVPHLWWVAPGMGAWVHDYLHLAFSNAKCIALGGGGGAQGEHKVLHGGQACLLRAPPTQDRWIWVGLGLFAWPVLAHRRTQAKAPAVGAGASS